MDSIKEALRQRILILDGAMGTMLQRHGLSGNSEAFNFSHPETVAQIHRDYILAGADIIETNSFGANRISQADYACADSAAQMALKAAQIARAEADRAGRKVWVAGSIGPTGKSLTLAQNVADPAFRPYSFDEMAAAYEEQIRALHDGGVDMLMLETCFDALNAKAAIYALLRSGIEIPMMISASPADKSGHTLCGQKIEAFYHAVKHAPLLSFGVNCSLGAKGLEPIVEDIASWAGCAVSCHPNAGLPNEMGEYDESPSDTARDMAEMARNGLLNIAGGCCGTTPEHIQAIAAEFKDLGPRHIHEPDCTLHVSGLESFVIDKKQSNFTNIGERTNVAGSRKFARLIAEADYEAALQVAAGQIEGGASVIDINMDDAMLDSAAEMQKFLRYISGDPAVAGAAIMVDSSRWETILAGLKNAQGKCIVNSISLKEGEEAFVDKAKTIKALGAAVVVMAFDESGQATTYDRKIEVCSRAYKILTKEVGFKTEDIIFDVNVLSIGTGIAEHARYGVDFIDAVRWIKQNLPGALTSGGISNLSFAFRGNNTVREAMHSAFLYHAGAAGLDMGIVNPSMLKIYDQIEPELLKCVEDVIFNTDDAATERLIAKAQQIAAQKDNAALTQDGNVPGKEGSCKDLPVGERIAETLVKADASELESDLLECLHEMDGRAGAVIEGPLMAGMAQVGELFGAGKMFLPQVIKSAKLMKAAVAILQPYLEAPTAERNGSESNSAGRSTRRPRVIIATVKGDVHDIGKNIIGIVLSCNGFEVIDLGVMVAKEDILAKAAQTGAELICASGLITPSLYQMEELCREMHSQGLSTPLLVGGATTSDLHTAVRLAPLYEHVFHSTDASSCAVLASRLISSRGAAEAEEHATQQHLRDLYNSRRDGQTADKASAVEETLTDKTGAYDKAAARYSADSFLRGKYFEDIPARQLKVADVLPYFDWKMFYAIWGMRSSAPDGDAIVSLNEDAIQVIERLKGEGKCKITISARFDACHSEGDEIVAADFRLPMLRQATGQQLSLCDFVAPEAYGFDSPMGMFAISACVPHAATGCGCPACEDSYSSMLEETILQTLAEAASGWLDAELSKQVPKGSPVKIVKPAAGYASCPDHTLKRDILALLPESGKLGIQLTESCAMIPSASICGLIFAHPDACYPEIRRIGRTEADEYAARRGMSPLERKIFLSASEG